MKKNISRFFVLVFYLLGFSCANNKHLTAENYSTKKLPPNGYPIGENFYCDRTEITNIDWMEYQFWTEKIFGKNSDEYLATQLDSLVWEQSDSCPSQLNSYYLRHPAYRNYPVVGVSHQQAIQFSKWRSDRVLEHIFTITGVFKYDTLQNPETYFTKEKYYTGNYRDIKPNFEIPFPSYRLPTLQDRIRVLNYSDSARLNLKKVKKTTDAYSPTYGTVISLEQSKSDSCRFSQEPTKYVYMEFGKETYESLFHLRGNVCEWSSDSIICFGGSFKTPMDSIIKHDTFLVSDTANIFTGFRNVCEWKYWTPK